MLKYDGRDYWENDDGAEKECKCPLVLVIVFPEQFQIDHE